MSRPGMFEDFVSAGSIQGVGLALSREEFDTLKAKWSIGISGAVGNGKVPTARDRDRWPMWAVALEKLAHPGDTGLGDVVARTLGSGGEAFKVWFKAFGRDCGCTNRQRRLNALYPL